MRTTISVDDKLLRSARRRARQLGLTLGELVEAALRRELARSQRQAERPDIPVFTAGTGLCPGVDATSTRGLLEGLDKGRPIERIR